MAEKVERILLFAEELLTLLTSTVFIWREANYFFFAGELLTQLISTVFYWRGANGFAFSRRIIDTVFYWRGANYFAFSRRINNTTKSFLMKRYKQFCFFGENYWHNIKFLLKRCKQFYFLLENYEHNLQSLTKKVQIGILDTAYILHEKVQTAYSLWLGRYTLFCFWKSIADNLSLRQYTCKTFFFIFGIELYMIISKYFIKWFIACRLFCSQKAVDQFYKPWAANQENRYLLLLYSEKNINHFIFCCIEKNDKRNRNSFYNLTVFRYIKTHPFSVRPSVPCFVNICTGMEINLNLKRYIILKVTMQFNVFN